MQAFPNPYRPGAGFAPPYLAGREEQKLEFESLLRQSPVLKNLILTGLRGVGKTVLLEAFKGIAIDQDWFWVGTDVSETVARSEENLSIRLLADLAPLASEIIIKESQVREIGFTTQTQSEEIRMTYPVLKAIYDSTAGLTTDKLKALFGIVWKGLSHQGKKGIVFAYDEAQLLGDRSENGQYPLSVLLEVFQSLQRQGVPFLLVLTGLPTIFPQLVSARTYSERMFQTMRIGKLSDDQSTQAIIRPQEQTECPVRFTDLGISEVIKHSGGYPYFIQYICKEFFDLYLQRLGINDDPAVRVEETVRKLDADFFSARWDNLTERLQELLIVISSLPNSDDDFAPQDILQACQSTAYRNFTSSTLSQSLNRLVQNGMIFKNKRGKYSYAVPMLGSFIKRQIQ